MADEQLPINASTLDIQSILKELEVRFSPNQVQWRVNNQFSANENWKND
jgi:hypothetical protein